MDTLLPNLALAERLLSAGKSILGLELGIVSKVYGQNYELIAIDDISDEFKSGDILQLDKTYCREVIETGDTVAHDELDGVRGLSKHPLYTINTLETYIGSPIFINDVIWGTVNFSSVNIRPRNFSTSEIGLVETFARLLSESDLSSL